MKNKARREAPKFLDPLLFHRLLNDQNEEKLSALRPPEAWLDAMKREFRGEDSAKTLHFDGIQNSTSKLELVFFVPAEDPYPLLVHTKISREFFL